MSQYAPSRWARTASTSAGDRTTGRRNGFFARTTSFDPWKLDAEHPPIQE
jgi:hypothetical protein